MIDYGVIPEVKNVLKAGDTFISAVMDGKQDTASVRFVVTLGSGLGQSFTVYVVHAGAVTSDGSVHHPKTQAEWFGLVLGKPVVDIRLLSENIRYSKAGRFAIRQASEIVLADGTSIHSCR